MRELKTGGHFSIFTQDGQHVENCPTIEDAIEYVIAHWHESQDAEAYTVRAKSLAFLMHANLTEATICPVGSDSLVVVRRNGDLMSWTNIHYVKESGKIKYTSAINRGIEYQFKV